jgi:hypothetical protein
MFEETQYGLYWKSSALSFSFLYFLTLFPLTGFVGADHFYARSYKTGLAKLIFNIFTLGFWYIWDALMILFDSDRIRTFGFSIPFYGPAGIGAGQFAGDDSGPGAQKVGRLFIYALLVLFAPLGIDYFYVGNTAMGLFKLVTTISVILLPLAILLGLWNIIRLYFFTGAVLDQYNEFFGSVPSPGYDPNGGPFSLDLKWLYTVPVVGDTLRLAETAIDTVGVSIGTAKTTVEVAGETAQSVLKAVGESAETVSGITSAVRSVTPEKFQGALNNALAHTHTKLSSGGGVDWSASGGGGGGGGAGQNEENTLLIYALPSAIVAIVVFGLLTQFVRFYKIYNEPVNTRDQRDRKEKYDTPPKPRDA